MTAGTVQLFFQVSGVRQACDQAQTAAAHGAEAAGLRRAAGRGWPCLLALLAAACAAEPIGQDGANDGSTSVAAAPPPQSLEAPEQEEEPEWLRDIRSDPGTFDRDRLARGLVRDIRVRGYGEELTYHTNAESAPYKTRSRELLERAEARAREARASSATASSEAVAPPAAPSEAAKSPAAAPPSADQPTGTTAEQKPVAAQVAARPAEPPDPSAAPADGPIRIQLASLRDAVAAEREFLRLRDRFPEILGGRRLYLEQVDLGDRGVFFRIQFGPFQSQTAAEQACARLRQRQQDCLVVMRRPA